MNNPDILMKKEIKTEDPIVLEGFPGVGLIGNIVTQHITKTKDYEEVGVIYSEEFPPVAMIYDGLINLPVRIYHKNQFIVIASDIPIPSKISNRFAEKIINWAKDLGTKKLISIGGISTMNEDKNRVFSASYNKEEIDKLKEHTEIFSAGNITGVSGSILTQSKLQDLPAVSLLGETTRGTPDPRAAVAVIEVLNKKYGLDVETKKLLEQAETIEKEMKKLAEAMKKVKQENGEGKATAPSPMYR